MKLADYLRAVRNRLWIVVLVPALAVLATVAVVLSTPQTYQASAIVSAPALVGGAGAGSQYSGPQGTTQFVAAFEGFATSPTVMSAVAAETHQSTDALLAGTTVQQVGGSSVIQVLYQTTDNAVAQKVAQSIASHTLDYLFSYQVKYAQRRVDESRADLAKAQSDLNALVAKAGGIDPSQQYDILLQQVASLKDTQLHLQASGSTAGAAAAGSQIADAQRQLKALAPSVATYQALEERRREASTLLSSLQLNLAQARSQADAASPAEAVTTAAPLATSKVADVAEKAVPAGVAGLLLGLGLMTVLELAARRRTAPADLVRPRPHRVDAPAAHYADTSA